MMLRSRVACGADGSSLTTVSLMRDVCFSVFRLCISILEVRAENVFGVIIPRDGGVAVGILLLSVRRRTPSNLFVRCCRSLP